MAECSLLVLKDFITTNTTTPASTRTNSPSKEVKETENGKTKKDSHNSTPQPCLPSPSGHSYVGFGFGC